MTTSVPIMADDNPIHAAFGNRSRRKKKLRMAIHIGIADMINAVLPALVWLIPSRNST